MLDKYGCRGAQPDVQLERRRVIAEQLPKHALAAQRVADLAEIDQRRVGIRRGGDGLQQGPRNGRQKMPAAVRRQERNLLGGQSDQMMVGIRHVLKAVTLQHRPQHRFRRFRIQHQVRFLDGFVVGSKRLVQQMIQNRTVPLRPLFVIGFESQQRRAVRAFGVAHPDGQLAQLVVLVRHGVRLQVAHDLQPVLQLAQQDIVFFERRAFLQRQAAGFFQPVDGRQRVARADLGQIAAVQQLEELDHELDVADAAVAGLDIPLVAPFVMRPLLDLAFQGLDAHDVGPAEVPAVDPRFDLFEEFAGQVLVARDPAGLDQRLPLPGAAGDVVVPQSRIDAGHRRPLTPVGPQPQVDAISGAQARVLRQVLDDLLRHPLEKLRVGDGPRTVGLARVVAQEDQIDVAGIVQFLAAQLAHRNRGKPRPLPVRPPRHAALLLQFAACRQHRRFANGIGQHRDLFDHRLQPLAAHDVPVGNPQAFPGACAGGGPPSRPDRR